jgi:hypothetical protein
MARSRRRSAGCKHGEFKPKKMGKGMSAHRPKLGYRPKPKPRKTADDAGADGSAEGGSTEAGSTPGGQA